MLSLRQEVKSKLPKNSLLKFALVSLLAVNSIGCDKNTSPTKFSKEKSLAEQYEGRSLASIRNDDYRPIQTKGVISEELREFYQNASNGSSVYNLEKLIRELVDSGLADSYSVSDISVIEGDLFSAKTKDGELIKVRMLGIDAPNKRADFYEQSSTSLSECIGSQKEAVLIIPKKFPMDNLGRVTAQVVVGNKICNLEQLKNGMAWFYKPMTRHQFDFEVTSFHVAESYAKLNKTGLWSKGNYEFNKPYRGNEQGGSPYQ